MTDLERRAQVEELHARRAVFADQMNADRLAEYRARRPLERLWAASEAIVSRVPPGTPASRKIVQMVRKGRA